MHRISHYTMLIAVTLIVSTSSVRASDSQLLTTEHELTAISNSLPRSGTISLKEWENANGQVSKTIAAIKNPTVLADLALWCHYCAPTEEQIKERSFVFIKARDACVYRISTFHTDAARVAIRTIKRSILLDGGVGRVVGDAFKELGINEKLRANFTFIEPKNLESMPLSKQDLQSRIKIVGSFWTIWEKEGIKSWPDGVTATCGVRLGDKSKMMSLSVAGRADEAQKRRITKSIKQLISLWKRPLSEHALQNVDVEVSLQLWEPLYE